MLFPFLRNIENNTSCYAYQLRQTGLSKKGNSILKNSHFDAINIALNLNPKIENILLGGCRLKLIFLS